MHIAVRIGLVYLISGLGGSLMSALFIRSSVSVGASGALFGLIGSMLSELITNWTLYANKVLCIPPASFIYYCMKVFCLVRHMCHFSLYVQVAALLTLIFVIAVNLALGLLPRVDNFAHIGGLISGFLLGFVFFIRPQFAWLNDQRRGGSSVVEQQPSSPVKRKHKTYQYVLWLAAAVLLFVGYVNMPTLDVLHQTVVVDFDFVLSFSNISSEYCLLAADSPWPLSCSSEGTMRTSTARGVSISAAFPQNAGNATHRQHIAR
jgi:hypothetical protein